MFCRYYHFDETNSNLIELVIPKGLTVSIFKTRPVELHITPIIILNFFKNLKYLKLTNSSESNKNLFYRMFFQLLCIYIKADLESLIKRDYKGLYKKALKKKIKNVVGIDLPFKDPKGVDFFLNIY